MDVTSDLRDFGYRELKMAAELLTAYKTDDDETELLGDGVRVMFNPMSGYVFLTDEDCNTAMMNGDTLEDWHVCGYCGEEGFAEDLFAEDSDHYRDRWGGVGCADDPQAEPPADEDNEDEDDAAQEDQAMSNQTTTAPAPNVDTATAYVRATTYRETSIELPDGTVATLTDATPDDRADVTICPIDDGPNAGGWRIAWATWDQGFDFGDPIDDYNNGDRRDVLHRFQYGPADMDDARGALEAVELGQGRRVFLVDEDGYPRRDWSAMRTWRWVYIVPEDVPADQRTTYAEAVWAEWRAWAAGEVYVVCSVDVDANGNELPDTAVCIGGIIGDDWAAERVQQAARYGI